MDTDAVEITDLFQALRLKRQLERAREDGMEPDARQIEDLTQYIEVMTGHGVGDMDHISYRPAEGTTDYEEILVVRWQSPSDLWRAVRRNINRDGIFVQMDEFPSIDTVLGIRVNIKQPRVKFTMPAKVIWVNPQARAGRPQGMGVKFLWRDQAQRTLFRRFLEGDVEATELASLR